MKSYTNNTLMKIISTFMYSNLHKNTNDTEHLSKSTIHFNSIIIKLIQHKLNSATSISVRNCCVELRDIQVKWRYRGLNKPQVCQKVATFNKNLKSQLLKVDGLRKKLDETRRKGTTAGLDTMIDPHTDVLVHWFAELLSRPRFVNNNSVNCYRFGIDHDSHWTRMHEVESNCVRSRTALALRSRCSNLLVVEISNRRRRRGNTAEVNVDVEAGGSG